MDQILNSSNSVESRRLDVQSSFRHILLSKLVDSVKLCQSEFGAKNELATADSSHVAFLLSHLEAAFVHGIKKNSFLKDVTDLVTKFSPWESSISSSIWILIKRILNEQESRRINEFSYITSDAGRFRCWLRMALNERSLCRCFQIINSHSILNEFYEDYAFLRDSEITAAFTQIVSGLETILFALSTNDPDLNYPPLSNDDVSQALSEAKKAPQPILNVGRERNNSTKSDFDRKELKKRKPLVNFVSFDKDRSFSETEGQMRVLIQRSSVPGNIQTTSSSVDAASDRSTPPILFLEREVSSVDDKLDSVFRGETPSDDLDDEGSVEFGSFDSGAVDDADAIRSDFVVEHQPSSMIGKSNGGEGKNNGGEELCFCGRTNQIVSLRNSADLLKSSLDSLKREYEDFARMHAARMNSISSELTSLKAAEWRKANNSDADCSNSIKEDEDSTLASIYEKRLIELSQMHGDLLELNESVMKENRRKTNINEMLRKELVALRGPLPEDLMREADDGGGWSKFEERPLVNIWIPSAFLTGKGADVHHVYQVYVRIRESEWNVYRRYKDFLVTHNLLSKRDSVIKKFKFPPKKNFGRKDKNFVDERRVHLESYLRMLVNYVVQNFPEFSSIPVGRETLAQLVPFFR